MTIHSINWTTPKSFNPRPRAGGDIRQRVQFVTMTDDAFQSAPPRGGRHDARHQQRASGWCVSIRAPARGATTFSGDLARQVHDLHVSIRAPARGATDNFQHAGDPAVIWFQSAPPRGGRLFLPRRKSPVQGRCFNPRPRAGGDDIRPPETCPTDDEQSFQSAPPRGGRRRRQYA